MANMFKFLLPCVLVSCAVGANLVEVLRQSNLSILISLVEETGLKRTLLSGQYTIFAPTDAAFARLPRGALDALTKDKTALANILKYHVVQGSIPKSAATNELQLSTINGAKIRFNIYGAYRDILHPYSSLFTHHETIYTIQGSKITGPDKKTDNGYVHVIDTVMLPPEGSILDIVTAGADFTTLFQKVKEANLSSALQGNNLTMFVPTNAAFKNMRSNIQHLIAQNPDKLKELLLYHVIPNTKYSVGLHNHENLRTLDKYESLQIIVSSHSSTLYINSHRNVVTKADIGATNGVIHVIDHVLAPDTLAYSLFG